MQRSKSWSDVAAAFPVASEAVRMEDIEVGNCQAPCIAVGKTSTALPCAFQSSCDLGTAAQARVQCHCVAGGTSSCWRCGGCRCARCLTLLHAITQVCYRDDGSLWRLGAGSFGTVFKAMKNGTTPVAVKVPDFPHCAAACFMCN
jgi:hypothetical protein